LRQGKEGRACGKVAHEKARDGDDLTSAGGVQVNECGEEVANTDPLENARDADVCEVKTGDQVEEEAKGEDGCGAAGGVDHEFAAVGAFGLAAS